MERYFSSNSSGKRYNKFRPKVHDVVFEWLNNSCSETTRFKRALDIACGTGDSLKPLLTICDEVVGVDVSDEMLKTAKIQNLPVVKCDYSEIGDLGRFDLLTTCMAFHWFDPEVAIGSYKAASNNGAIWLIYNFALSGHETSEEFNEWYKSAYIKEYPSPPRNRRVPACLSKDRSLSLVKRDNGWLPIEFSHETLVGYLSTQSNVEHAVVAGRCLENIADELLTQLSGFDLTGNFKYSYTYEMYEFNTG